MIACSIKEGEELVRIFLAKGADVNAKSKGYYISSTLLSSHRRGLYADKHESLSLFRL